MKIYKALMHIEQIGSLLFKAYVVYFMWLFIIATPQMTVANIGQLVSDKWVFSLILSMVILIHGSMHVLNLASKDKQRGIVSNGSSVRANYTKQKSEGF